MKLRTTIGTIAGTGLGAMVRVIGFGAMAVLACAALSVSYTHLTLPTICSV